MTGARYFALTAAETELLPTEEDVRFYRDHGYYLSKRLFSDEEMDEVFKSTEAFYDGHRDRVLPADLPEEAYWLPAHGDKQRHNDYICYENGTVERILCKPLVGAVAACLMNTSEARLWSSTLINKPARKEDPTNIVPWHIDLHHWRVCTSEELVTAFVPLNDCGEENGTINVIDGSHKWKELPLDEDDDETKHFADRDPTTLDATLARNAYYNNAEVRKIPVSIERGRVSFHHCKTYHGSGPNVSGRPRRVVTVRFQDKDNEHREYSRHGGGTAEYYHDRLVRRTTDGRPDYSDPEFCPVVWRA